MTREEAIKVLNTYDMSEDNDDAEFKDAIALSIKALEQEPCNDCISRQAVLDTLDTADKFLDEERTVERYKALLKESYKILPSVTPQEPKTGHWRKEVDTSRKWDRVRYYCSNCGDWQTYGEPKYCPNCGCRMESEEFSDYPGMPDQFDNMTGSMNL